MLDLQLREEFRGRRLKGTTIDFTNTSGTGALDKSASDFLEITYPSVDLLKTLEAAAPGKPRPVVLLGSRGQGKSHLLATLYHALTDTPAARTWLNEWSARLNQPSLSTLHIRSELHVIAESLHLQNYKYLWDLLLDRHPHGAYIRGKWEARGEKKTDVPSYDLLVELFKSRPTALILDEFQTWYDGLTNTKQYPWKNWAFNFIQILSEIAQNNPELLVLVVSIRDGGSEAYQQIHRVNPVHVDFKGPSAKRDRQRLLLHRLFENRLQVAEGQIEPLTSNFVKEYMRLANIAQSDQARKVSDCFEAWPYDPRLFQLLEDQVLVAADAQETRDLIRILADLFRRHGDDVPIITAADFRLDDEKSGIAALLDSVANQHHKTLREKAQRNLEAVLDVVKPPHLVAHAAEIIGALWLRSLTVDNRRVGAEPASLQIDITRSSPIDDNSFQAELDAIVDNSFNIHRVGNRLIFREEENPQAKLLAFARNDRLFSDGSDIEQLAKEARYVIGGSEDVASNYRVVVLKKSWRTSPWSELSESDYPDRWDSRIPIVVLPEAPEQADATLGKWLRDHVRKRRNTVRFLLPKNGTGNIYYDKDLIVLARAVLKSQEWKGSEPAYGKLLTKYEKELRDKLKERFDRFALLEVWNFSEPDRCSFQVRSHGSQGVQIPPAVERIIRQDMFIPEDFEEFTMTMAMQGGSVGKLLSELQEPRPGDRESIPWLGEIETKERVIRLCAAGRIAINLRGMEFLQATPGESSEDAWQRMKGKLGTGRHLDETYILTPSAATDFDDPIPGEPPKGVPGLPGDEPSAGQDQPDSSSGTSPINPFSPGSGLIEPKPDAPAKRLSADPTSALNLVGKVESWRIGPATSVRNVRLSISDMTGAQLQKLLQDLPGGVVYGLDLEKESN